MLKHVTYFTDVEELILSACGRVSEFEKIPCYAIGGFVRDKLLSRPTQDIDIVCLGNSQRLAEALASYINENIKINSFKRFGVSQLVIRGVEVEIVTARKESYQYDSRNPIVEAGTLEDDFNRRDFTMNTLAMELTPQLFGKIIDPFKGTQDVYNKRIVTPLDPQITFSDDPLRMMRAIRFASQLNFTIDETTWQAIIEQKERLQIISKERICDELNKTLMSPKPSIGLHLLDKAGLWEYIIPEVPKLKGVDFLDGQGHKDNFFHTLQVVDNVAQRSNNLWLRWAALLHDIAKPQTKRFEPNRGWTFHGHDFIGSKLVKPIFQSLHLPLNEKMRFVAKLVLLHLRPIALIGENVTDSAIRRLLFEAGEDIEALMMLCESDITSKRNNRVEKYLNNFMYVRKRMEEVQDKDKIRNFKLSIDGVQIMQALQIPASKKVGTIKQTILDAVLDGKIENTKKATHAYMMEIYAKVLEEN